MGAEYTLQGFKRRRRPLDSLFCCRKAAGPAWEIDPRIPMLVGLVSKLKMQGGAQATNENP